jgi:poly-beta-1,6-N-acetyl-D-glucosamine synthase
MGLYYWISIVVVLTYAFWMGWLLLGLLKKSAPNLKKANSIPSLTYSVVIPFKNEANNLPLLLASLEKAYEHFSEGLVEVICVDDHSTDNGVSWLLKFKNETLLPLRIVPLTDENKGKKEAIQTAVHLAQSNFIITTDADCVVDENWLKNWYESFLQPEDLYIGLVFQKNKVNNLAGVQQEIESLLLQGITKGTVLSGNPLLCSGANLGYSRMKFLEWNPYIDNLSVASGDDMFLLQKAQENKAAIGLSSALVYTPVESNWGNYIQRSVRWSGKIGKLKNPLVRYMALLTFLVNLLFLISWFLFVFEGVLWMLFTVAIKFFVDFFSLFFVCLNFNRLKLVIFAPLIAVSYPIYLLIVGVNQISYKKKDWS